MLKKTLRHLAVALGCTILLNSCAFLSKSEIGIADRATINTKSENAFTVYTTAEKQPYEDSRIQQATEIEKYILYIQKNWGENVLNLVKSAHAITSYYLDYEGFLGKKTSERKEIAITQKKADCLYFSYFTYSNFLCLCEKLNRNDLKEEVRVVGGVNKETLIGHQWLEVRMGNKWHDYEATTDFYKGEEYYAKNPTELIELFLYMDNEAFLMNEGFIRRPYPPIGIIEQEKANGETEIKINPEAFGHLTE